MDHIEEEYMKENELSEDGYSSRQSPGGSKWSRRLWVGGGLHYPINYFVNLFCKMVVRSKVLKIEVKGHTEDEKVFVHIERRHFKSSLELVRENRILAYMGKFKPSDRKIEPPKMIKSKTIQFSSLILSVLQVIANIFSVVRKIHGFSLKLIPTPILLFRFSALTFNSHKIHYDPLYAQKEEGHPGILVHGPLQVIFALELLRRDVIDANNISNGNSISRLSKQDRNTVQIDEQPSKNSVPPQEEKRQEIKEKSPENTQDVSQQQLFENSEEVSKDPQVDENKVKKAMVPKKWVLQSFQYRNIAPAYAGEQMRVCGSLIKRDNADETRTYQLWIQGPEGNLCMKGTAIIMKVPPPISTNQLHTINGKRSN